MREDKEKPGTLTQRLRRPSLARLQVLLFLVLWLAYGAAINSDNLSKFNLQQIGVEAIVERHQFYLEGSDVPELFPQGDVFLFQGHKYAAKQPGQFLAGAVVYWVLSKLGLRYKDNYLLTSALVTFFTTSLVLALSAVAVFRIVCKLANESPSLFWPLLTTFAYALATTVFAYSGIAHHDALATGYLVIAFYLIFHLPRRGWDGRGEIIQSAGAGLFLGLAVTTSMLVFFMAIVCAIYFLWLRRWKLIPFFLTAIVIGLLPLFVYDAVSFGNPFLLPNVAGAHMFADTFFQFSAKNFGDKIVWYSTMLVVYAPVFVAGLFGLSYYPNTLKRTPVFLTLVAMLVVLAVYILNIRTGGDCQFGPRYLLPAMPFACLGIAGFSYLSTQAERRLAGLIVLLISVASFAINLLGAVQGSMCCPDGRNALRDQLALLARGGVHYFPLAPWLVAPLLICAVLLLWTAWQMRAARDHFTR
jgi:4-amino-4-deoxy-L-arabinose transferase-like glycosyltransferase